MITYKDAGVDIDSGNLFVELIKDVVSKTYNDNLVDGTSFSGGFKVGDNVLYASTDGVGTKIKLAVKYNKLDGLGFDLVGMCVNDLLCNFAEPLFFLDYFATGKLDLDQAVEVVKSIADACIEAECVLLGGETAEMPDMYKPGDFDLAGFAVGLYDGVDRNIRKGDILVALPSNGFHSNGFSLIRRLLDEDMIEFDYEILNPTKIYVKEFKKYSRFIKGLAHITGGGLIDNVPRIFPEGLYPKIYTNKIRTPKIFEKVGKYLSRREMYRTFNMGIGMVLVIDPDYVSYVKEGYVIGEVVDYKVSILNE